MELLNAMGSSPACEAISLVKHEGLWGKFSLPLLSYLPKNGKERRSFCPMGEDGFPGDLRDEITVSIGRMSALPCTGLPSVVYAGM
jgi:hypothetical protein